MFGRKEKRKVKGFFVSVVWLDGHLESIGLAKNVWLWERDIEIELESGDHISINRDAIRSVRWKGE